MRAMMGQMSAVVADDELQQQRDFGHLYVIHWQLSLNAMNVGALIGQRFSDPPMFQGELSLLPESLRAVLREATPDIEWTLLDDTVTVSDNLCQQATTTFRGVKWRVCYTEDVSSSVGPWRLRGLPGLIVQAESEAHTFTLIELRQEALPITYERKPDVQRMAYAKLLKHRNEVYGHEQYANNPTYYIPNLGGSISHMEVYKNDGQPFVFANNQPLLTKAHVFQPLELK